MYRSYISRQAEREDKARRSVWYSFRYDLPDGPDWQEADFYTYSVWGNGNNARDHWGYPGYAPMDVSKPLIDPSTGKYYITVNLLAPTGENPPNGHYFGFTARAELKNGEYVTIGTFHRKN